MKTETDKGDCQRDRGKKKALVPETENINRNAFKEKEQVCEIKTETELK